MPEPMPRGLTFFVAITRAIVLASLVKRSFGGYVETVETLCDQRFTFLALAMSHSPIRCHHREKQVSCQNPLSVGRQLLDLDRANAQERISPQHVQPDVPRGVAAFVIADVRRGGAVDLGGDAVAAGDDLEGEPLICWRPHVGPGEEVPLLHG